MNISFNWLKELIETDLPPQEIASRLTSVGLTVESIHQFENDFVFDIDLTSNRGDCLSHLGVARELSVITKSRVQGLKSEAEVQKPKTEGQNLVTIQDPDLCNRFTARIISNVKIAPSPQWLVKRLEAIGERAINNVADITNYVMHELGQPMHSFDIAKLKENRIVVRRAKTGETIKTLDEVERKLDETMLAICDAAKPVAVAGVMGGFDSGITNETNEVLLEVAYFKRDSIRQTSRGLGLATEASYRFERGVDIENLISASNRATELICELAGGTAGDFVDVYPTKFSPQEIPSKQLQFEVKRLTDLDVESDEILRILNALGFKTKDKSRISQLKSQVFIAPTWRHDVSIEEDLVEEVARHVGYDKIGEELPPTTSAGEFQPNEPREKMLRRKLADLGFDEAISYSFIDAKFDDTFELVPDFVNENAREKFVTLRDSVIEGAVRMRPTLLSGLLDAVRTNFNFGRRDLRLFELGRVFAYSSRVHTEEGLPEEREFLALALTGGELLAEKAKPIRETDFYDAKGALESVATALNISSFDLLARDVKHLSKGQSAEVRFDDQPVGTIGRLNEELAAQYKFRQPVFVAEIDLQALLEAKETEIAYEPLPIYPSIERDISLIIKRNQSYSAIRQSILSRNLDLLRSVSFVDVYEGKGIAADERSLTIRLTYRADERTLLDEEADAVNAELLKFLKMEFGAKLRA